METEIGSTFPVSTSAFYIMSCIDICALKSHIDIFKNLA